MSQDKKIIGDSGGKEEVATKRDAKGMWLTPFLRIPMDIDIPHRLVRPKVLPLERMLRELMEENDKNACEVALSHVEQQDYDGTNLDIIMFLLGVTYSNEHTKCPLYMGMAYHHAQGEEKFRVMAHPAFYNQQKYALHFGEELGVKGTPFAVHFAAIANAYAERGNTWLRDRYMNSAMREAYSIEDVAQIAVLPQVHTWQEVDASTVSHLLERSEELQLYHLEKPISGKQVALLLARGLVLAEGLLSEEQVSLYWKLLQDTANIAYDVADPQRGVVGDILSRLHDKAA
ncbi:MAG: hypothetical protein ACE5FT_04250 [Candidatus Nanoarchaeia archaeon]